jgi:glycosyltransferase involved in cell wall biosynthesis
MLGKGWFPDEVGGLDRYFRSLYDALSEDGVDVHAVVVGPAQEPPPRVSAVSSHAAPLARRLMAFHRAAVARAGAADVLNAHFALYAMAPMLLSPLRRIPTVIHFQGAWTDESVAAGDSSRARRVARAALERAVYRRAAVIVVLSQAVKRALVERFGIPPWTIRVIPPGVDTAFFCPGDRDAARAKFGVASDAFVLVVVRRLVPRMGVDVLLDAVAELRSVRDVTPTVLIAGDGTARSQLERRAHDLGLDGAVRFLGRLPDDRIVDLYQAADLNVVPSVALEGFGLVVLEAAACGIPSVVTAVGGLPEAAALIEGGIVVPAGDVAAMARAVGDVMQGRRVPPERGAVRRAVEGHDWRRAAAANRDAFSCARRGQADPRLRVVYLGHVARLSGAELALLRLLPALEGVNPHVILGEDGPLLSRLHAAGISAEVLPMPVAARDLRKDDVRFLRANAPAALGALRYTLRLTRYLRRLQPDLVHANSLKAGVCGTLAARLAGVPVVWHVRDRIDEDYLSRAGVRLVRLMTRRLPDGIVVNSESTGRTLTADRNLRVVPSVLPDTVHPRSCPYAPRSPRTRLRVGMVGRLAPWKGQHVFLEAFARAFRPGDAEAVIIGEAMFGEDGYAEQLSALIERLKISEDVDRRGFREDIWNELSRLDILVHASVTPEPFGQVVLEGMAAGLPVITTTEGGPAEFVEHGITALQVPARDEVALAEALTLLATDRDLRIRLGAAAHAKAAESTPVHASQTLMELYESVLARHRRRAQH